MPIKDRDKRLKYRRNWYKINRVSEIENVKNRKLKIKNWLNEKKHKLKCNICGENHPATIEFHHKVRKNKGGEISKMVSEGYSINIIQKEMDKCEILCSNCHRKLHYQNSNL